MSEDQQQATTSLQAEVKAEVKVKKKTYEGYRWNPAGKPLYLSISLHLSPSPSLSTLFFVYTVEVGGGMKEETISYHQLEIINHMAINAHCSYLRANCET
eukprot:sb/3478665/